MAFSSISYGAWATGAICSAALLQAVAATNPCYFPDGDTASSYVPFSPNGDGSCCASGDFCTQWGYCISNSKGYHYRGACTDTTWGNPSCPDYCLANDNSGNSSAVNVIACDAASDSGTWCCAYDGNCCNSTSTYKPTFGTIFAEPGSSSTSSSAASSATGGTSGTSSPSNAASTTASSSSTSSSAPTAAAAAKSNTGTIVGAAVGVPLGLAALAALFLFWRERNKNRKAVTESTSAEKPDYRYYTQPDPQNTMVSAPAGHTYSENGSSSLRGGYQVAHREPATGFARQGTFPVETPLSASSPKTPYELSSHRTVELPGR